MSDISKESLTLLQKRVSVTQLVAPHPTDSELLEVFKAAMRAADHGKLKPWRFLVISGAGLAQLGEVFVAAGQKLDANVSPTLLEKFKNMPMRAPMIVVAIAVCHDQPKVPKQEQIIACGASVQNMLNAFFALGYGAVWRSGDMAYSPYVKSELNIESHEEIIGFVYVGTPAQPVPLPSISDPLAIFSRWPAN